MRPIIFDVWPKAAPESLSGRIQINLIRRDQNVIIDPSLSIIVFLCFFDDVEWFFECTKLSYKSQVDTEQQTFPQRFMVELSNEIVLFALEIEILAWVNCNYCFFLHFERTLVFLYSFPINVAHGIQPFLYSLGELHEDHQQRCIF